MFVIWFLINVFNINEMLFTILRKIFILRNVFVNSSQILIANNATRSSIVVTIENNKHLRSVKYMFVLYIAAGLLSDTRDRYLIPLLLVKLR